MDNQTLNSQIIDKLELLRKKYLWNLAIIIFSVIVVIGYLWIYSFNMQLLIWSIIMCGSGIVLALIHYGEDYRKKLKKDFLPNIMSLVEHFKMSNKAISLELLRNSCLFAVADVLDSETCLSGIYNNVKIDIISAKVLEYSQKVNIFNNRYNTSNFFQVFKGVIIIFNIKENAVPLTMITTKNDNSIIFQSRVLLIYLFFIPAIILAIICLLLFVVDSYIERCIISFFALLILFYGVYAFASKYMNAKKNRFFDLKKDRLKIDDARFENKYKVYSLDKVQGLSLVTHDFIKSLNNMGLAFGTSNIKCSFFDDKVMLAIPNGKNIFEYGNLFTSLKNPQRIQTFFKRLTGIIKMAECLNSENDNMR